MNLALAVIPFGQWLGGVIESFLWVGLAAWLVWGLPRQRAKKIREGKLTQKEVDAQEKYLGKPFGILFLIGAVVMLLARLFGLM